MVRRAKLLIVEQYSHSLQHAFIGELIGKVGRGVLRERKRERERETETQSIVKPKCKTNTSHTLTK